jgi:hypothetical protein
LGKSAENEAKEQEAREEAFQSKANSMQRRTLKGDFSK